MLRSIRKLVSAVFSVAAISGATGASAGDHTFPLATARDYLALTKTLADSDRLDEPDKVGRVLGTTFLSETHKFPEADCAIARGIKSQAIVHYTVPADFWYLSAAPRAGELPPQRKDFSYQVSRATSCSGRHAVNPDIDVRIRLDYLRGRICVTDRDIQKFLPEAARSSGPEGTTFYNYQGYTTKEYGVLATLSFAYSECARDVSIMRGEGYGNKAKRVRVTFDSCLSKRLKEPPFKYPDYEFCGTFDALMDKDP